MKFNYFGSIVLALFMSFQVYAQLDENPTKSLLPSPSDNVDVPEIDSKSPFQNLKLYAFDSKLHLKLDVVDSTPVVIHVYDITGREVISDNIHDVIGKVDKSYSFDFMTKGIYIIYLQQGQNIFSQKISL